MRKSIIVKIEFDEDYDDESPESLRQLTADRLYASVELLDDAPAPEWEVPSEVMEALQQQPKVPDYNPFTVFAGPGYYPGGGWTDYVGTVETKEEAEALVKATGGNDWFHFVQDGKITFAGEVRLKGKENTLIYKNWFN